MSSNNKNVTFSLPKEIIDRYRKYAKNNDIASVNAGVREALEEYSARIEKQRLKKRMAEAAKDPMFIDDLEESMKAFDASDTEEAGGTQEW